MAAATKETVATAAKPVRQEIINMAEAIRADLKIDHETSAATVGKDLYERMLPEGLDKKTVEMLQTHNAEFATACALALGESTIPVMKKHAGLERVNLSVPATGKDAFNLTFERKRMVSAGFGSGEQREKFGVVTTEFKMYGTGKRGDLRAVYDHLEAKAAKSLGGK